VQHYLGVGRRLSREFLEGREAVNLKKYFYVVRPALCLKWVREGQDGAPPMNITDLMARLTLPSGFVDEIAALIRLKAQASEIGEGPRIAVLDHFIVDQFAWADNASLTSQAPGRELVAEADALFREIVRS